MSRWLTGFNQVSNLLEKLDDRVENVVEERTVAQEVEDGDSHGLLVDDILTRRGLVAEYKDEVADDDDRAGSDPLEYADKRYDDPTVADELPPSDAVVPSNDGENDRSLFDVVRPSTNPDRPQEPGNDGDMEKDQHHSEKQSGEPKECQISTSTDAAGSTQNEIVEKIPGHVNLSRSRRELEIKTAPKESQKEVRVLRRHVVKLNGTLEQAESEIAALRAELARAGERMEKDRNRAKEQKEAVQKRFTEEMNAQKLQYDQTLKDQQVRFEEQISNYKVRLSALENQRIQEGGDWNKEMSQAFEREQEMKSRVTSLEDEKTVLLNQISTLQSQQTALGSRVESLTQASENATAREKEAEDRLDATLSQHARQISLRQTREAELERTIQELNAALVSKSNGRVGSGSGIRENEGSQEASLRARIEVLEGDLRTTNSQLTLEKERSEILHQQLKDISKESTEEVSSVQAKQLQYQQRASDMALTISKLEASLRDAKRESSHQNGTAKSDPMDEELAQQVKILSEEVLRLRDKLGSASGELLALKNRLQVALRRAAKAEEELANALAAPDSRNCDSTGRAGGIKSMGTTRRNKRGSQQGATIRSVMRLEFGQGNESERLGKVIDSVDGFAVSTGKYLRRSPLARAAFIFYLLLVHLWSFVLLFFHAHNFDESRSDVGITGNGVSVGPHALVEQHKHMAGEQSANLRMGNVN